MNRRTEPYIWVTWITGLLAGDKHCEWAAWFRANHQDFPKLPRDTNLAVWKAEHGEMLRARVEALKADPQWTVYVENQNKFTIHGKSAVLAGQADIVTISKDQALVIDCKTGQPRDSDIFQVLVYMLVLPFAHPACLGQTMTGELQYKGSSVVIPPQRLTPDVKALIRSTIQRVSGEEPRKTPSFDECQYCDLAGCPERMEQDARMVVAEGLF